MNALFNKIRQVNRNNMSNKLQEKLTTTLTRLISKAEDNFSGFGCIVYNGDFLQETNFISLRPKVNFPQDLVLAREDLLYFLLKITQSDHKLHDGFVFFNRKGHLTHVSQFIEIRLSKDMKPHPEHGTRYLTSKSASLLPGVELIGMVGSNKKGYLFRNGSVINIS